MLHIHKWLIENHVFYNEYNKDVKAEELKEIASANLAYLDKSNAPVVHILINLENMGRLPLSIYQVKEASLATLHHPKMGWMVVYGNNESFVSFLTNMVVSLTKTRYKRFDGYEEAMKFLKSVDSTIPDFPENP